MQYRHVRLVPVAVIAIVLCACPTVEKPVNTDTAATATTATFATNTPTAASAPIRIGYQKLSIYAPVFIAQDKGFFREQGLTVELSPFTSANQMMNAVLAGQLEGTGLSNVQVALSVEAKDPGKARFINFLVWNPDSYADYFITRKGSGIKTVKGVQEKTVGIHPGSAVKAFATALLESEGVDIKKTPIIELEPATMAAALVAGRIDALYCMDPVATKLVTAKQADVLVHNPIGKIAGSPVPISGTLIASSFAKSRANDARSFEAAIEKAIDYIRDQVNHAEMARIVAKYTDATAEDIQRERVPQYWKRSEIDRARVRALSDRFRALGIIPEGVSADRMIME